MTSAVTSMTGLRTSEQTGRAAVRTAEQIATQQDHTQNSWNMVADATGDIAGISTHGNQQASDGGKQFKNDWPSTFRASGPARGRSPLNVA
jgi:hypothetical protein